jgi:hypothetical protein
LTEIRGRRNGHRDLPGSPAPLPTCECYAIA